MGGESGSTSSVHGECAKSISLITETIHKAKMIGSVWEREN